MNATAKLSKPIDKQVYNTPITGIRTAEISNAPAAEPAISELYEPAAFSCIVPVDSLVAVENCVPVSIPEISIRMMNERCTRMLFVEKIFRKYITKGRMSVKIPVRNCTL